MTHLSVFAAVVPAVEERSGGWGEGRTPAAAGPLHCHPHSLHRVQARQGQWPPGQHYIAPFLQWQPQTNTDQYQRNTATIRPIPRQYSYHQANTKAIQLPSGQYQGNTATIRPILKQYSYHQANTKAIQLPSGQYQGNTATIRPILRQYSYHQANTKAIQLPSGQY